MQRVLIIADDLTGALDSAAAFARRGVRTRVATQPDALAATLTQADVIAVATGTRELSAIDAASVLRSILPTIGSFDGIVVKKIDSRMKGHIAAELAVLREILPRPILACPAIPVLGRYVEQGCVTGAGVERPIPVAPTLGCPATVLDATTQAGLQNALPAELNQYLYVGAAGLCEAIAAQLVPSPPLAQTPELDGPLMMAIGSRDPVTLAQIAASGVRVTPAPNGRVPVLPGADHHLIQIVAGHDTVASALAARDFADGIVREMRRRPYRTLFACGGETAHAILKALGIRVLDLQGELFPGVPVARCPGSGLVVVTKSGGFGDAELIRQFMQKFAVDTRSAAVWQESSR